VDLIFLAAPNTPQARLKMIEEETSGFLYLVPNGCNRRPKRCPAGTRDSSPAFRARSEGSGLWHLHSRAGGRGHPCRSRCCNRGLRLRDLIARGEIEELEQLVREMKRR